MTALLLLALAQPPAEPLPAKKTYTLGPDSKPQAGVPAGKTTGPTLYRSTVYPGTVRKYWVHVPAAVKPDAPACVVIFQDGQRALNPAGVVRAAVVLDNLTSKREIPPTVGVFVTPGHKADEYPDKLGMANPNNRAAEYDALGDAYARFLADELLPEVAKSHKLTDKPEERAVVGFSSGGIAAFTAAWERPDVFRRVYSAIGSFTDIRGGHVYPDLVARAERKPIRVFLQDGVHDNRNPANPKRDWWLQNQKMDVALKARGYDYRAEFGAGGHSDDHGGAILPDALRWLWRDHPAVSDRGPKR